MVGLSKPRLLAKFEVASFSRCTNIKGEPQILGSSYSTGPRPLFLRCGILWWALANPSSVPILKLQAPAVPKISGSFYSPLFPMGVIL